MLVCVPGEDMTAEACRKTKQEALSYLNTRQVAILWITKQFKYPQKTTQNNFSKQSKLQQLSINCWGGQKKKKKKNKTLCISTKLQLKKKKAISQECQSRLGVTKLRRIFEFSSSWRWKHQLIWLKHHKLAIPHLQKPVWTLSPVHLTPNGRPYFRRGPSPLRIWGLS